MALAGLAARPQAKPWVLYVVGLSHMALDRPRDAAAAWERVRKSAPEFPGVYRDLAAAHLRINDLNRALDVLLDAQRRWPSSAEFHNAIGVIHTGRGDVDSAIDAFVKAVKAAPDDPVVYLNLGLAYEMRLEHRRRSVTVERQSAARWAAEEADRRRAEEALQRCIDIDPADPYAQQAAVALERLRGSTSPKR